MRRLHSALLVALVLSSAATAEASPLFDTAGSIGGNAGSQGIVSGPGAASTYFNPALLIDADEDLLLAFAVISEQIGVHLDARNGGDVPLVVGDRGIVSPSGTPLPNDVVPTQWLNQGCPAGTTAGTCPPPGFAARPRQSQGTGQQTHTYVAIGLVKHLVPDRLTFGFYGMIPLGGFTTAQSFYPDEREALFSNSLHPELYGDRLTAISLAFAAGFKLTEDLSVGVGVSLNLTNNAGSQTYVRDTTDYSTLLLNTSVKTQVDVSPFFGVRYKATPWLRFGGGLHAPESFKINTAIDATLPTGTESGTVRSNVYDWSPWAVDFGVEADVFHSEVDRISLTGSIKYAFWSDYEDRMGQNPDVYGSDLAWKDTLSGALGARWVHSIVRTFLDLKYVPSPVPEQVGRSNYVDNSRVGIAAGADVEVLVSSTHLRPGLQLFVDRLVTRHNTKDDSRTVDELPDDSVSDATHTPIVGAAGLQTNNPGWPGYSSHGWVWGGAITLAVPL